MRDDRYRGTSLSRQMRKLCHMSEREADRAQPERLRTQAVLALVSDANREISNEFRRKLQQQNSTPQLFGARDLALAARTPIEVDIARALMVHRGVDAIDAIGDALLHRSEACIREQKCQLIADRHSEVTRAITSVQRACSDAILVASVLVFDGRFPPKMPKRPMLTENLLAQNTGAAL